MKKRIITLIALLVFFSVAGYGLYTYYQITNPESLFKPDANSQQNENTADKEVTTDNPSPDAPEPDTSGPDAADHTKTQTPTPEPYKFAGNRVNILLMGLDASTERYETMSSFRTDTMMIASVDFENNKVYLISIPRDSYVRIPGRTERGRVNAAFVYGGGLKGNGFETTIETVEDFLCGITIDYYAAVDMNAFKKVIDIMGGVEYEVDIPVMVAGRKLEPGLQTLSGQQALDYARIRNTGGGDIDRVDRQQRLVLTIFDQMKSSKTILKIPEFYTQLKDDIHTNLNVKQIAALALYASKLGLDNIDRRMIPGGYLNLKGVSYWGIDQKKKNELVNEVFGMNITEFNEEDDIHFIRNELQKQEQYLNEQIRLGQQLMARIAEVLRIYRISLLDEEQSVLDNGIISLTNAINSRDAERIASIVNELETAYDPLLKNAQSRYNVLNGANNILNGIKAESAAYADRLQPDEAGLLDSKMNTLQEELAQRDTESVPAAQKDLSSFWDGLKQKYDSLSEDELPPDSDGNANSNENQAGDGQPAEGTPVG